ncbi:MAG: MBG domain-containing protein [Terriglobia bacterium]
MTKQGNAGQHENVGAACAPKVHSGHFARTQWVGRRRAPIGPVIMRAFVLLALAGACFVVAPGKADAQTTYFYRGNNFNSFSCGDVNGLGSSCSTPTAGDTYTTSDYVFASLTVTSPLAPNLSQVSIYDPYNNTTAPGFLLTMQDGQQTFSSADSNMSIAALVSTDSNGNITSWWAQLCGISGLDNCVSTANNPGVQGVQDYGQTVFTDTQWNEGAISGSPGAWYVGRSGTATWFYLEGDVFGLPFGPYTAITGGDNVTDSTQWNFEIPSGWTYGHGQLNSNGSSYLSAGAYAASSGPCSGGNCDIATGAARGLAYETFTNTGAGITVKLNAALEGEFINSSGGIASAAVYVVDAGDFASAVPAGSAAASFLLANSSITNFGAASLSLAGLFPEGLLATSTATEQASAGSTVSVPVITEQYTVKAGESITVIFDVAAYAPEGTIGGGPATVNFASTLAPGPNLFTDVNNNPVTQIVALAPPLSTPPTLKTLTLSTTTTSAPVGTPATITVTATDTNGNLLPNATVFFSIISGPDSPMSGPALTNANGQAAFTYPGGGASGTDVIQASAGAVLSNTESVTWSVPGPLSYITISPANATTPVGVGVPYTTAAFDQFGNSITETGSAVFGISAGGSCTGATCTASTPGPYTVTATYSGVTAQTSLTVGSSTTPLIITASNTSMTYGSTPPTPTAEYTYGSFTLSPTAPAGLTAPACVTSATSSTPVGTDTGANTCSGASGSNYSITYAAGNVMVSGEPVTITATNTTMTFGGTAPTPSALYTYGNLTQSAIAPAGLTALSCVTSATSTTPVGTDSGANTCFGASGSNYSISYAAGNVTVSGEPVTITASNTSMTYGSTPPKPTPEYTYGSVTLSATAPAGLTAPACVTSATSTTPVGTDTGANTCSGASGSNYSISYAAGNVTVSGEPVTITASNTSMTYGSTPPKPTPEYTYGSVTLSATAPAGLTAPACVTSATSSTPVGTDTGANTCSGASGSNYSITYGSGNVTVNAEPVTITASNTSMTQGSTPPTPTPEYTYGSVTLSATAPAGLTAPTCVTTATSSTAPGTDTGANTCSGASGSNYSISYVAGNVVVNPAGQTGQTFTITPNPAAETVTRGVVGGFLLKLQSVDGFDGNVKLSCSGGPAGSYCVDFPMTVKVNGTAYAVSGILFPKSAKPGTYVITFTGVSGSQTVKATASFTVK